MPASISVAVVDEHEIFRRGLVTCLREDPVLDVVLSLPTGPLPVDADVAVTSPRAAATCDFACPLVVCGYWPDRAGQSCQRNLVLGCVPRTALTPPQLLAAVHAAAVGLRVLVETSAGDAPATIGDRGLDVLRLLAEGADTQEIAASLNYSERTIKGLIQQVEQHLGARNRAQAVALGIRQGII